MYGSVEIEGDELNSDETPAPPPEPEEPKENLFRKISRQPRTILFLLAGWSILTAATQIFVNSGIFIDIHDREVDGALGGFGFSLNAVPLAALYIYCIRHPGRHPNIYWLGVIHMGAIIAAAFYHWVIGTYSAESIIVPVVGSGLLGALSFFQVFEPKPE